MIYSKFMRKLYNYFIKYLLTLLCTSNNNYTMCYNLDFIFVCCRSMLQLNIINSAVVR